MLGALLSGAAATAQDAGQADLRLDERVELRAHEKLIAEVEKAGRAPAPFTTDGCSGWQSAAWAFAAERIPVFEEAHGTLPPWEACCVVHDRAYHRAGDAPDALQSLRARQAADDALAACVEDTAAARQTELGEIYGMSPENVVRVYKLIAQTMLGAVRLGGAPCTGLSWRWGYGYPDC